jgi:hypothetical protein
MVENATVSVPLSTAPLGGSASSVSLELTNLSWHATSPFREWTSAEVAGNEASAVNGWAGSAEGFVGRCFARVNRGVFRH